MSVTEKSARSDSFSIYKHFSKIPRSNFFIHPISPFLSGMCGLSHTVKALLHFCFFIDRMPPVPHKQPEYFQQPALVSDHLQTSQTVHLP